MNDRKLYASHAKAAVRTPSQTILRPSFWISHLDYAALLSVATTLLSFSLYVYLPELAESLEASADPLSQKNLGNLFLVLVGTLAGWAVVTATRALAETALDRSIAIVIESDADKKLKELQGRPGEGIDLGVLKQILPTNYSKPEPGMIRLAQELVKEAHSLRLDARDSLSQRYRHDSISSVFRLERLQKYALRVGILGTFVGLILALNSFATLLVSPSDQAARDGLFLFNAGSQSLVESLALAFGTSIAGLAASLFVGAQAEILRRRQMRCFRHMEDAALSLTTLATRALQRDDLLSGLEHNTKGMKELQAQIYDQSLKIESALGSLDKRIVAQTSQIESGLARLSQAREGLDEFLGRIDESHRGFLRELASIYDRASLEQMIRRIEESVDHLGEEFAGELRSRAAEVVGQFEGLLGRVSTSHMSFLVDLKSMFERAALDDLVERIPESVAGLGDRLAIDLGDGIAQVGGQFGTLRDQVVLIEKDLSTAAQDLASKTSTLQAAIQSIDSQVTAAASESRRTMKEVSPALQAVRDKLDTVRFGSLVVFDAPLLRKLFMSSAAGLALGALSGNAFIALACLVGAPALLLTFPRLGGAR